MSNPLISIVLPVRNEADHIERCLLTILAQDYSMTRMEVLVVDGMSTDDTRRIINDFSVRHPLFSIRILENPGRIVPTGMNIALRQVKGEIVIRVDGHCLIAPNYVSKCVEHLQKDDVDGVGGSMESIGETSMAESIAIGMSSPFGVGNSAFRTISGKNMLVDTVPFPAYTWEVIKLAGLYDEELIRNQDDEYNFRIRELGGKILLTNDVHSKYFSRSSLPGLWRQYFQYGYWKVRVMQKHPGQMSLRQFVPPLLVLALLGSFILTLWQTLRLFFWIMPLFYTLVNVIASLWTAFRRPHKYSIWLPAIFAILHLSYGIGFLTGLLKFWNRWTDKIGKTPEWLSESFE